MVLTRCDDGAGELGSLSTGKDSLSTEGKDTDQRFDVLLAQLFLIVQESSEAQMSCFSYTSCREYSILCTTASLPDRFPSPLRVVDGAGFRQEYN